MALDAEKELELIFFRRPKQCFISCTPSTECICPKEVTITPQKILNQ